MATIVSPHPRRANHARPLLTLLLALAVGSYAAFGDRLIDQFVARVGRAGLWVGDAADTFRERLEADDLDKSHASFAELLARRDTLAGQVAALREHRAAVAARLDREGEFLSRVTATRSAAGTHHRVAADETELARCDAELGQLAEYLGQLDRAIEQVRFIVQRQADDLYRRRAASAGVRAYRDGLELANTLVDTAR